MKTYLGYSLKEDKVVALTAQHLEQLLNSPAVAVDVETPSLVDRSLLGLSICADRDYSFYFTPQDEVAKDILNNPAITKVYHNIMFDVDVLDSAYGSDLTNIFDTMLVCRYTGLERQLGEIANTVWGMEIKPIKEILGSKKSMEDVDPREVVIKCCKDTIATWRLYLEQLDSPTWTQSVLDLDMAMVPLFVKMNKRGVRVNQEKVAAMLEKYQHRVDYYREICEEYAFQPGSYRQVGLTLADQEIVLPITESGAQLSTKNSILEKIDHPLASIVIAFRKDRKMINDGLKKIEGWERVYAKYGLDSDTGRTTCSARVGGALLPGHINFQQQFKRDYRKEIRTTYIPDGDQWTIYDCSQLELRVLAWVSGDIELQSVFDRGEDPHSHTGGFIRVHTGSIAPDKELRDNGKTVNYGMTYGGTDQTIAEHGGIDLDAAAELRQIWRRAYPQAYDWILDQQRHAVIHETVRDNFGRDYYFLEATKHGFKDEGAIKRKAVNSPIQGMASALFKKQLLLLDSLGYDIAIEVHDEAVIEGEVELPVKELEHVGEFATPLDIKVRANWE